ncbi:MAG: cytochrome c biogenesis protein CcsA [Bacteroidota bacterium]
MVCLHLVYLTARTIAFNHPPVTTVFEILTVVAFSVALAYLVIEMISRAKETGYFIINIAFFFQLLSSLFIRDLLEVPEILRSNLFGLHVSAALLGYAAITISAVYGFLYLMLYHQIKATNFGAIYQKLPNLEVLEKMSFSAFKMAFVLLGVAIIVGLVWLPRAFESFSYSDPKLVGTITIWLLYGLGIYAKTRGDWKGRKVMVIAVLGFCITIMSMMVINVFFSGFHNFT